MLTLFQQIVAGSPTLSDELSTVAMNIDEPGRLVDFIASSLPSLSTPDKQDTLETLADPTVREGATPSASAGPLRRLGQRLANPAIVRLVMRAMEVAAHERTITSLALADAAIQPDLLAYSVSEDYFAVRKFLGLDLM